MILPSGGGPLAVVADIHGNRWALEAVLEELDRRGLSDVLDLGDVLYGPLDPAGTLELLQARSWPTISGNQDRVLLTDGPWTATPTHRFTVGELGTEGVDWLRARVGEPLRDGPVLACHGTPEADDAYLLEVVEEAGARARTPAEVDVALGETDAALVLCGHTHVFRDVTTPRGIRVVNPGSVGLPAYDDDAPYAHVMESGTPHARFVVLHRAEKDWRVDAVALDYDHESAARAAQSRGREDWATWLRTGRA